MESRSERICGSEALFMEPQNFDPECSNFGQVLIPPVMSAQIELITTVALLQPLKKAVLEPLRKLIEKNRTQSWFTIYLCLFILLHSCSLLTEFEYKAARKYGLLVSDCTLLFLVCPFFNKTKNGRRLILYQSRYVHESFVKELHHGSTILLSYFHYCNKGSHPLLMDWEASPDVVLAELKASEVEFLKNSSQEVKKKSESQVTRRHASSMMASKLTLEQCRISRPSVLRGLLKIRTSFFRSYTHMNGSLRRRYDRH